MDISRKFSSIVLVVVLLVALPIITFANGPEKKVVDYVALGDSLAAGMTPTGGLDLGYPDYLVNRFEQSQYTVGFKNFGVPGYTSTQLKNDVLTKTDVQMKIIEAEFITIDIGSNDLLQALSNPAQIPATIGKVAVNLQTILAGIDMLNPTVKVYVMGYYNPFPYMPQEQLASLLPVLAGLNQTIEARAIANGDTYVGTDTIIAKDYQTYLPNPLNIHLSKEGYQLVAKEFWKNIDKSKN
ncbi:MAG: SGNH/GDSL hydrolase family protein [Bacillus sp. (in: Bacteria)]|nr:SGNH/GDSL hydrolase family protein [Bacillus sp. (in: firmicutes)]